MRIDWDTPVSEIMNSDEFRHMNGDDNALMHWKYIRKERALNGNGWTYYYPNGAVRGPTAKTSYEMYDKKTSKSRLYNLTKSYGDGYGEYTSRGKNGTTHTLILEKSNRLFSGKSTCDFYLNGKNLGSKTVKSVGILERTINSAVNWLQSLSIFKKKKN